jgi:ketosteroid isomerase-like protein
MIGVMVMTCGLRLASALALCTLSASVATAADSTGVLAPALGAFLRDFEQGTEQFMNGDPAPWKANASQRNDVMIMGAWGAHEKGWSEVSARYDWAAARFRDADAELEVEYLGAFASGDLAVVTAIERATVKLVGQAEAAPMALRVTHVFRRENGAWKLVLRHADPLVEKTAPETVLAR